MPAIGATVGRECRRVLHERDALALDRVRDERLRRVARPPGTARRRLAARAWSWPSHVSTCQPKARSFDSRSPSARISSVGLSDWSSLRSTTIQRPPSRSCAADCSASQFWPSCSSPSPVITTARPPRPARRFAQAIPRPFEMPMPSEPEFASMPGTPTSGCPSRPPRRRSRARRSAGTTPSPYSAAYRPGTSWPLEEKKTSRPGSSKPTSTRFSSRVEEVSDDVERAEARPEVPRACALHGDERVQPADVRDQREQRIRITVRRQNAVDALLPDERERCHDERR